MGVWTELVGVRKDLHLRGKWWHHVAIAAAVFSTLIVYFSVAGRVVSRPLKLTAENTFSLTLLHDALGRQATTTLADLDALAGYVGTLGPDGSFVPLRRVPPPDTVRCESRARYRHGETVKVDGVTYRAISDQLGQPDTELRHCIAAPAYAHLAADSIATYVPAGSGLRKQNLRAFFAGLTAALLWLMIYWNAYYRAVMPFYARYRRKRREQRLGQFTAR